MLRLVDVSLGKAKESGAWPYVSALHNVYQYYGVASGERDCHVIIRSQSLITTTTKEIFSALKEMMILFIFFSAGMYIICVSELHDS